jgi:hypothetical protein
MMYNSGNRCRENANLYIHVIARSASDEAIQTVNVVAVWIASRSLSSGRAFARTRWLAMTVKLPIKSPVPTAHPRHRPTT